MDTKLMALFLIVGVICVLVYVFVLQKIVKSVDHDVSSLKSDVALLKREAQAISTKATDVGFALEELRACVLGTIPQTGADHVSLQDAEPTPHAGDGNDNGGGDVTLPSCPCPDGACPCPDGACPCPDGALAPAPEDGGLQESGLEATVDTHPPAEKTVTTCSPKKRRADR